MMKAERYEHITYVPSEEIVNTFNNLCIYINNEYDKYSKLANKADYKAPRRSVIVFHESAAIVKVLGKAFDNFNNIVDRSRELGLFDFIFADMLADYKDISREKSLQKLFMDSNGVLLANTYENQMYIELNTRDIRIKDALADNMGYIVENGKGYYSQILQYTEVEGGEEDEI
jgi:hypothetical protein